MEKLIEDGRIHPAKIEEVVEKAKQELEETIKEEGERAVLETGVIGLHPDIVKLIGKLKIIRISFLIPTLYILLNLQMIG